MFKHEKMLFHPVEIEKPNPQYAVLLQEQLGGANGELKGCYAVYVAELQNKGSRNKRSFP